MVVIRVQNSKSQLPHSTECVRKKNCMLMCFVALLQNSSLFWEVWGGGGVGGVEKGD